MKIFELKVASVVNATKTKYDTVYTLDLNIEEAIVKILGIFNLTESVTSFLKSLEALGDFLEGESASDAARKALQNLLDKDD